MTYKSECRRIVRRIAQYAHENHLLVWVDDEMSRVPMNSTQKVADILDNVFATDESTITIKNSNGAELGQMLIVHDFEGDSDELIADYTDNKLMNEIYDFAQGVVA
jgi:hypothetical protein